MEKLERMYIIQNRQHWHKAYVKKFKCSHNALEKEMLHALEDKISKKIIWNLKKELNI